MTKIAGSGAASGSESGSISQRPGSADPDPDPHQNVKDPQHSRQGFSYYFCLVIEGSGSRRSKNMWIRSTTLALTCLKSLDGDRCCVVPEPLPHLSELAVTKLPAQQR
jgi:hypothetical protein